MRDGHPALHGGVGRRVSPARSGMAGSCWLPRAYWGLQRRRQISAGETVALGPHSRPGAFRWETRSRSFGDAAACGGNWPDSDIAKSRILPNPCGCGRPGLAWPGPAWTGLAGLEAADGCWCGGGPAHIRVWRGCCHSCRLDRLNRRAIRWPSLVGRCVMEAANP